MAVTGINAKSKLDKMDRNPFFMFSKPYMDFIGTGKIFGLVYFVMAGINLLVPFGIIYKTVDSGIFGYVEAKYVFAIILSWLVILFACWIGFQIWWIRRLKVINIPSTDFVATTCFSEIIHKIYRVNFKSIADAFC